MTSEYIQDGDDITREELETAIEDAWTASTSANPSGWDEDNPSYGQCAVTALLVQDMMGGDIIWRDAVIEDAGEKSEYFDEGEHISHYFNEADDEEIDLTRQQFPDATDYQTDPDAVEDKLDSIEGETLREYVLDYEPTVIRYRELKTAVFEDLARDG